LTLRVLTRAGSVSVFGVGIGIRYFRRYFFMSVRYSVSVSVTDPAIVLTSCESYDGCLVSSNYVRLCEFVNSCRRLAADVSNDQGRT